VPEAIVLKALPKEWQQSAAYISYHPIGNSFPILLVAPDFYRVVCRTGFVPAAGLPVVLSNIGLEAVQVTRVLAAIRHEHTPTTRAGGTANATQHRSAPEDEGSTTPRAKQDNLVLLTPRKQRQELESHDEKIEGVSGALAASPVLGSSVS
jgi:hypothetical protein